MKQATVRRTAGAALALVLALVVVGSVGAAAQKDRTPPTAPTNLRVTSLTQKSVTLTWDASTDNSRSFSYSVSMGGQGFTVPQTQTTYTIDWLSPGQTYTFHVTAVDAALNESGQSNTVTVTTPRDRPHPRRRRSPEPCVGPRRLR